MQAFRWNYVKLWNYIKNYVTQCDLKSCHLMKLLIWYLKGIVHVYKVLIDLLLLLLFSRLKSTIMVLILIMIIVIMAIVIMIMIIMIILTSIILNI